MRIALDYDDTITRDEILWRAFVDLAKGRGHDVAVVTSRFKDAGNEDVILFARAVGVPVFFAEHRPKREVFNAEVWIDDMPETIGRVALIGSEG